MKILTSFIILFTMSVSIAQNTCKTGCQYVSTSGMPSGGCGENYNEALFSAQKNCMENAVFLFRNNLSNEQLRDLIQSHCSIPGADKKLLQIQCENFASENDFLNKWKSQVCKYKKEYVFSKNLVWSKWYDCE